LIVRVRAVFVRFDRHESGYGSFADWGTRLLDLKSARLAGFLNRLQPHRAHEALSNSDVCPVRMALDQSGGSSGTFPAFSRRSRGKRRDGEQFMTSYVALLRAVNVGGTGKLPMSELKQMCLAEGYEHVQTYIASGNVVFKADRTELEVKRALETRLESYAGKPVGVMVRTASEMRGVLEANPFPEAPAQWTVAIFLDDPPVPDVLSQIRGQQDEHVQLGTREIYVAYGSGMGRSKLRIPAAASGTARNLNTIAKLVELAS